jgi:hypothetical protein
MSIDLRAKLLFSTLLAFSLAALMLLCSNNAPSTVTAAVTKIAPTTTALPIKADQQVSDGLEANYDDDSDLIVSAAQIVSFSPVEVAAKIKENFANQNNVDRKPLDLSPLWQEIGATPWPFDKCDGDCEASIATKNLSNIGNVLILSITREQEFSRFLLFTRNNEDSSKENASEASASWKLLGCINSENNKYERANWRVLSSGDQNWLIVRSQGGSGSGFAAYWECWYEINQDGLYYVLNYPANIHFLLPKGIAHDTNVKVVRIARNNNGVNLALQFTIHYRWRNFLQNDYHWTLWRARLAYYHQEEPNGRFQFDFDRSGFSQQEMMDVYYEDDEGVDNLIKYNFDKFNAIARGNNNRQKDFLSDLLDRCDDIPEKQQLLQALDLE